MSAAPRRLAIVCRIVSGLGGTTTTILEHARRFGEAGWSVDVVAERADVQAVEAAGARLRRVPGWPWGRYFKRWLFAKAAERLTLGQGYDVVHGHGDELFCDVLSLHNCVHDAHEALDGRPAPPGGVGRLHDRILRERRFKVLIANSEQTKRDVVARYGLAPGSVEVIYPGCRLERFKPEDRGRLGAPLRAELGFSREDVVFGLITSGDFEKRGVTLFLGALARLARGGKPVKALIAGKENRLAPYLREAGREGLAGAARFLPAAADVERYFHACDVYVHPARYEEFGQSVLEAMACGLPVVCGPKVGASELFGPGLKELVAASGSEEELAEKMARLLGDAELRRRLGEEARGRAGGRDWALNARQTLDVYQRLRPEQKR